MIILCVHYKEFKVLKEPLFIIIYDMNESLSGAEESLQSHSNA